MAQRNRAPSDRQPSTKPQPDHDWWGRLILGKERPTDCVANVHTVLQHDPAFADAIRYDMMRGCVVARDLPWQDAHGQEREWTDRDDIALARWLQLHDVPVKPATVAAAVTDFAMAHAVDPLRERLEALKWDKKERISNWLVTYLGVEETEFVRAVGRKWLISAVARALRPGCKVDTVLILEGPQGAGKSRACSLLALDPSWFADDIRDLGTKDSAQDLRGKWIVEIAELSAMRRSEVERVKAFISRPVDHYRPSYSRRSQDFPRRCVFIGSNNSDEYLADSTGGRRFWPARAGEIDLTALRRDVGQLWAEAVAAFKAGERWWLDAEIESLAHAEQDDRRIVDPWEEKVLSYAREHSTGLTNDPVTIGGALMAIGLSLPQHDQTAHTRVGRILTGNGWVRHQKRSNGQRVRFYLPPIEPAQG